MITLSKFKDIEISCDSSDPELFAQLRRGADLKRLVFNIANIRATAALDNREPPKISFSCVVNDKNVMQLKEYVSFGLGLGIRHFNFCNLTRYPDVEGAIQVNHVSEMPFGFVREAQESLNDTFSFLKKFKIRYEVQQGLLDTIKQKLSEPEIDNQEEKNTANKELQQRNENLHEAPNHSGPESNEERVPVHRFAVEKEIKQTRNCLDPWHFVLVTANRDVLPCCWHEPLYSLSDKQSLGDVFNNAKFQELRLQLLTGELSADCANCPARGLISTKSLRIKVLYNLIKDNFLGLLKNKFNKKQSKQNLEITYEHGWYPEETNLGVIDRNMKNWRWTGKKATCSLALPKTKATLIIYGGVNKKENPDQPITIHLNRKVIDEFVSKDTHFYKEYTIQRSTDIEGNKSILEIETSKTFKPSAFDKTSADSRELGIQIFNLFWHNT